MSTKYQGVLNISNEEYHSSPGISRSKLLAFKKSPFHYWYEHINSDYVQPEPTKAMEVGSALHIYLLEEDKFEEHYHIVPKVNRTTKIGKEAYTRQLEEAKDKCLIQEELFLQFQEIKRQVSLNDQASEILSGGKIEQSIYWTDEDTGLLCKVRPDIWQPNFVADLKTTKCAAYKSFQYSLRDYGYYLQAAMIYEALNKACNINMTNFIYVAIEKEPPFACAVYMLDVAALLEGVKEFKAILRRIKECQDNNSWPSYQTQTITLPNTTSFIHEEI